MSHGDPIMIVDDVSICYETYDDPRRSVRQLMLSGRRKPTIIRAVQNVDLTLYEGEVFGMIGANGSGKSTLLTAMTGLVPLDTGTIRVKSRPRLLGVNAALRPGVSGRRNLVLGGMALGIPRAEIEDRLEELVDFVDIGEAIDRPMRTYSSGMKSRIGFAVATISAPDILLVDEALVVGDAAFKSRSQERIEGILEQTGTVVMVTHSLDELAASCDRVGWLRQGILKEVGDPDMVIDAYLSDAKR